MFNIPFSAKLFVSVAPDHGQGATLTFASGFGALALSMNWTGITREAIETTNLATTAGKTFQPSRIYDPGELAVELQLDSDLAPPITATAESVTITFPDAETRSASGFLTSFEMNVAGEEVMTASATIKFTGAITW